MDRLARGCVGLCATLVVWHVSCAAEVSVSSVSASETCQWETFSASCPEGRVVVMDTALYGRMASGRCIKRDYGYVGCFADVLSVASPRCSGRRSCQLPVPDRLLDATRPCPDDLKTYLQANYTCVPVIQPDPTTCRVKGQTEVTSSEGNFSSLVTMETGCGATNSPWRIKVSPGQQVNLTLWDFGRHGTAAANSSRPPTAAAHCHVLAIIKESAPAVKTHTVCGGALAGPGGGGRHIYTSVGAEVELRLVVGKGVDAAGHFIIQYTASGCADLSHLPGVTWHRSGDTADLGCQDPGALAGWAGRRGPWRLTCRDNRWHGTYGNCSEGFRDGGAGIRALSHSMASLSHGSSVLIIVAVAVVIGLAILVVGLVVIRRKRLLGPRRRLPPHQHPGPAVYTGGKAAPYVTSAAAAGEPHPLLLPPSGGGDPYYGQQDENEYAYVEEFGFGGDPLPPPPPPEMLTSEKMVDLPPRNANPYESTRRPNARSNDHWATGPGHMTMGHRSRDHKPPQYFVLDPEALGDAEDRMVGLRENNNTYSY